MHPNHKLHTRLQLIKRLLNTSNCELIFKCILSDESGNINSSSTSTGNNSTQNLSNIAFNSKFSFYLNALMSNNNSNNIFKTESDQVQQISNNDREILIHLDEILCQSGLSYKAELAATLQTYSKTSIMNSSEIVLFLIYICSVIS
jgi:hypothetical protein